MDVQTSRAPARTPWFNRAMLRLLNSPLHRVASGSVCELRYRSSISERVVRLPVEYAVHSDQIVVVAARATEKRWWRAFARPRVVSALVRGRWFTGVGHAVHPDDPSGATARAAYLRRHKVHIGPTDRIIIIAAARPTSGPSTG